MPETQASYANAGAGEDPAPNYGVAVIPDYLT